MNVIVFEDDGVPHLFPITTGRPAYAISCGSFRLIDWLTEMEGNHIGLVRGYLETLQLHDYPDFQHRLDPDQALTWFINARLVPSVSNLKQLYRFRDQALQHQPELVSNGRVAVTREGWAVTSAVLATKELIGKSAAELRDLSVDFGDPSRASAFLIESELKLFHYPHEVVDQHLKTLRENLQHRISVGKYRQHETGVFLKEGVTIGSHVVLDASLGPVVVEDGVSLGPFSLLRGPVHVGRQAKLSEYASVKDHVAIGHHCKIGGEVEASVIESYTNKQHHGFLGHSYIGSWINLGAGTCNSDLKNTYGTVNAEYGDRKVSTEMQFFGCVIGDYAKTAINTSIFTGKIIGTGSMVYGFATTNVPSFVNYARTFGELGNLPPEVIVATQGRMFARRNVQQRPCDVQLIHDMYRITANERPAGLSDQPLTL